MARSPEHENRPQPQRLARALPIAFGSEARLTPVIEAVQIGPFAVLTLPEPSSDEVPSRWRAIAGFRLVPRTEIDPPAEQQIRQQADALSYVLALPHEAAMQLRVSTVPRGIALLCAISDEDEDRAVAAVRSAVASFAALGRILPAYRFLPIVDQHTLASWVSPFSPTDIVEILRSSVTFDGLRLPLSLRNQRGCGVWLSQILADETSRTGQPLSWVVTLEPATGLISAADALTSALGRAGLFDGSAVATLPPRGLATAVAFASRLEGRLGRAQAVLLAGDGLVPDAAIAMAINELCDSDAISVVPPVGPAFWERIPGPRRVQQVSDAVERGQVADWDRPNDPLDLRRVVDASQAGAILRIPVPQAGQVPGLVERARREYWLAQAPDDGPVIGDNVASGQRQPVRLSDADRLRHGYVVGQTGAGKSTLLLNLIVDDMLNGRGLAVIDPHGALIDDVLARVPTNRIDDVILLDPADVEYPVAFNFLEGSPDEYDQIIENFIGMLYALFDPHRTGIVGPRLEHAVRNAMLTVMEAGDATEPNTLVEVVRVLTDFSFVRKLLPLVRDPMVRRYWTDQIEKTSDYHRSETLDYFVSKFSPFVHNKLVRNIIGQSRSSFTMRGAMDNRKILLVSLDHGRLGSHMGRLLGSVLVPRLLAAAMARGPQPEGPPFTLYVDEFQHYASESFQHIISGARKYGLAVMMSNQNLDQLPISTQAAIFGNVGTIIAFRLGVLDSGLIGAAMPDSIFAPADYLRLPNFQAIARTLIQGVPTPAFSLATVPAPDSAGDAAAIRAASRARHARLRRDVEEQIALRAKL